METGPQQLSPPASASIRPLPRHRARPALWSQAQSGRTV